MKFKLQKLSLEQYSGWLWASFVYGICIVLIAIQSGYFDSSDQMFPIGVFIFCWLVGVLLVRIYIQNKDPTDLKDLLRLKKKRKD